MNHIKRTKRYGIGILGIVSLLSVLFITASPGSDVVAQTNAGSAAVRLDWSTASSQTTSNPAIFTIEYESNNCDVPIGGTLHGAAVGSSSSDDATLGSDHEDHTILTTHFNPDLSSTGGTNADICDYTLRVTASLNCTFTVREGNNVILTVTKDANENRPSVGTVLIGGQASTSTTFFDTPVDNLDGAADGTLGWTNTSGTTTAITDASGVIAMTAGASDCDAPVRSAGFSLINAEPEGSLSLAVEVAARSGCNPDSGDEGEISRAPGDPNRVSRVILSDDCTYDLTVGHDVGQVINEFNAAKSQCSAVGLIYEVSSNGNLASQQDFIRDSDSDALRLNVENVGSFVQGDTDNDIAQITMFISGSCPQTAQVQFEYEVLDSLNTSLRATQVDVTILPTVASDDRCSARPNSFTIDGASDDRDSTDNSVTVTLVTRAFGSRTCEYVVSYPTTVNSISLVGEPGNNFKSGTGTTTTIAIPGSGAVNSQDSILDGSIVRTATSLRSDGTISFIYGVLMIPITISAQFPDDAIFTTQDIVDYRISVVDECARFSQIVSRALGGSGDFRSVQAYPGTNLVAGPELSELTSPNNQGGEPLSQIAPIIVIDGRPISCSIQVQEVATPEGCSVVGGGTMVVTYAAGLAEFTFLFDHECTGRTIDDDNNIGPSPGRGLTA